MSPTPWIHRRADTDIRAVSWGAPHAEVVALESENDGTVMPALVSVETEYQRLPLRVMYQFVDENQLFVCAQAAISLAQLFAPVVWPAPSPPQPPDPSTQISAEEMEEARRNGTLQELLEKKRRARRAAAPPFELHPERAQLDVAGMEHIYGILKQLLSTEYGTPTVDDGPLQEDPEWGAAMAAQNGTETSHVLKHCCTSQWETPRTFASLSISPAPFGRRTIMAVLQSVAHNDLLNAAPPQ